MPHERSFAASSGDRGQVYEGEIELALFVWFTMMANARHEPILISCRTFNLYGRLVWVLIQIAGLPPKDWKVPPAFTENSPIFKDMLGRIALEVMATNRISIGDIDRCLADVAKSHPGSHDAFTSVAREYASLRMECATLEEEPTSSRVCIPPSGRRRQPAQSVNHNN